MDKQILSQYIDACELVKETEEDIQKIKRCRNTIVQSVVKGSMHDFPYAAQNYHVEGLPYTVVRDQDNLKVEEKLLEERKAQAETIKLQVEAWMNTVPMRIQRIIRYRIFRGMKWEEIAVKIKEGKSGDAYRKQLDDYLKEK